MATRSIPDDLSALTVSHTPEAWRNSAVEESERKPLS